MVRDPVGLVVLPPTAVGRRRPQRLQRAHILISAIAKSSPFYSPRILTDCNNWFLVGHMEGESLTPHAR